MQKEYDILETFVREQKGVSQEEGAGIFLLKSEEFPRFYDKVGRFPDDRFLVFIFPFEIYLNDGDRIEFDSATIKYDKEIIPVYLTDYSKVRIYVKDDEQNDSFRKILEIPRRDIDLLNFVKKSYTGYFGKQVTPRLVTDYRNQNL